MQKIKDKRQKTKDKRQKTKDKDKDKPFPFATHGTSMLDHPVAQV